MPLIGSAASFKPHTLKYRWKCQECECYFQKGFVVLASVRAGRVQKKVCSEECRLTFDDRYWQDYIDYESIKWN